MMIKVVEVFTNARLGTLTLRVSALSSNKHSRCAEPQRASPKTQPGYRHTDTHCVWYSLLTYLLTYNLRSHHATRTTGAKRQQNKSFFFFLLRCAVRPL